MEFKRARLDNGLTIIAEVNPSAASMASGFFVRTGSRDETQKILGVSHFLEHMVFKGTATRNSTQVNREFDRMGAIYNAFTSENDPYGEHDFGIFEIDEELLVWKIDYYDPSLRFGSQDPADPSRTKRVLTIMLEEEC